MAEQGRPGRADTGVEPWQELADAVAGRLAAIGARIREHGDQAVRVVAVTKGFGTDVVRAALACGLEDLGENYPQELIAKAAHPALRADGVRWHMIGRLQRNKVRSLAGVVSCWQSVDREPLVAAIAAADPGARVMLQLNLSSDPGRGGCAHDEVAALVHAARDSGLHVVGLMGLAALGGVGEARAGFRRLVALADELELEERSIGMSGDFEVAVEEGATMLRLGTALFGRRPR